MTRDNSCLVLTLTQLLRWHCHVVSLLLSTHVHNHKAHHHCALHVHSRTRTRIDERSVSRRYHAVAAKPCLARRLPRTVEAAAERESTSATASATAAVAPTMAAVEPADAADGRDCGGQKSSAASTSRAVFWLGGVVPTSTARFGRLLRGVETASSATRRARSASAAAAAVAWFALRSAASSACAASASATRRACSSWTAMSAKRELA